MLLQFRITPNLRAPTTTWPMNRASSATTNILSKAFARPCCLTLREPRHTQTW